jgi:hypothetical protein
MGIAAPTSIVRQRGCYPDGLYAKVKARRRTGGPARVAGWLVEMARSPLTTLATPIVTMAEARKP